MEGVLNSLSVDSEPEKRQIKAGPVSLALEGVDAHTKDLFKLACI